MLNPAKFAVLLFGVCILVLSAMIPNAIEPVACRIGAFVLIVVIIAEGLDRQKRT